jgi:hypothetical protein
LQLHMTLLRRGCRALVWQQRHRHLRVWQSPRRRCCDARMDGAVEGEQAAAKLSVAPMCAMALWQCCVARAGVFDHERCDTNTFAGWSAQTCTTGSWHGC